MAPDLPLDTAIESVKGSGQPLPSELRAFYEPRFGHDFSRVRIHADSEADSLNRVLHSRAFTTRQDVFFRQGEYTPGSSTGRKLLAHELTHAVQQSDNIWMQARPERGLVVSQPRDQEREAEAVADSMDDSVAIGIRSRHNLSTRQISRQHSRGRTVRTPLDPTNPSAWSSLGSGNILKSFPEEFEAALGAARKLR